MESVAIERNDRGCLIPAKFFKFAKKKIPYIVTFYFFFFSHVLYNKYVHGCWANNNG